MRLAVFTFAAAVAAAPAADDWPGFRGPHGNGVADVKSCPVTWGENANVGWKVAVHDKGWSSPILVGDKVWVTTAAEDGTDYYLVGLDRATGRTAHDIRLFRDARPPDVRQYNSYSSPTPCAADGRVFAHFGSHGTACVEAATGRVVWKRNDLPCDHHRGPGSSPVAYAGKLYLLFDGFDRRYVACLDAATGRTVWTKDRELPYPADGDACKAFATPAVHVAGGRAQVICPAAVGTVAYDADTGAEVWRVVTGGMNQACRPVVAGGLVYLTCGHLARLIAVRAGRAGDLTADGVAWRLDKGAPTRPSPLVVGGRVFLVNDTGIAMCLDAATGAVFWRERLDGKFSASPVYAAGRVYFFGENGKATVVTAGPAFEPVAENRLAAGCLASPAVGDGELVVRTTTHVYRLTGR